jgi:hypothetical protein
LVLRWVRHPTNNSLVFVSGHELSIASSGKFASSICPNSHVVKIVSRRSLGA